jgi:hypothetical protein
MSIEAMKRALDVLENTARSAVEQYVAEQKAITALRLAIEEAEKQEPQNEHGFSDRTKTSRDICGND